MNPEATFLRGSYTPLVTPFRDGRVDLEQFAALIERQIEGGSQGIVVAGTTGEATSLSIKERGELFRCAVSASAGRLHRPLVKKVVSCSASLPSKAERNAPAKSEGGGGISDAPCSPLSPKARLPRTNRLSVGRT